MTIIRFMYEPLKASLKLTPTLSHLCVSHYNALTLTDNQLTF